jgi:hypothetical protein
MQKKKEKYFYLFILCDVVYDVHGEIDDEM